MTKQFTLFIIAAVLLLVSGSNVRAQDRPEPEVVPLHVQVTISRYLGDEVISSLPYLLSATANGQRSRCSLRMGADVPIATTSSTINEAGQETPRRSFNYRPVGVNIDCEARTVADDRYQLLVNIEESSVYPTAAMTHLAGLEAELSLKSTSLGSRHPDIVRLNSEIAAARLRVPTERRRDDQAFRAAFGEQPVFRSFQSSNTMILRDGQSVQYTAAADRISGESIRVDVRLTVLE